MTSAASGLRIERHHWLLGGSLLLGFAVRCAVVFGRIDVVWPDEIFQYTEQAHRLVFGSGVIPWEYIYGIRSWLLPGIIAAVMAACSRIGDNPLLYIQALRLIAAALSMSVVAAGFAIALRAKGPLWAGLTAFLCAIWYQSLFFDTSFIDEVLAAFLMFPAVVLAERREKDGGANAIAIGILLGLAFCLRYQTAPALLVIAGWYCRTAWRDRWLPLALAASAVIVPILGVLDYATLGTPFQSVWLNYDVNALRGIADRFGRSPSWAYLSALAWPDNWLAAPVICLAVMGAFRAPLLALTAAAIVLSHSAIAHKEFRFICFAAMAMPILIGLGLSMFWDIAKSRVDAKWAWAGVAALAIFVSGFSRYCWTHLDARLPNDAVLKAFAAAHDAPDVCGLGVADFHWSITGGYSFFHRDVPVYFAIIEPPTRVVSDGGPVRQYPGREFFAHGRLFNYLVVSDHRRIPGYDAVGCFSPQRRGPSACLLHRSGGCASDTLSPF